MGLQRTAEASIGIQPFFPNPGLADRVPVLVELRQYQMSKSRGNTIDLRDSADAVARKVRGMYAGPPRAATEPGKVSENPVFLNLDAFDPDAASVQDLKERYERTGVSNKELKDRLTLVLNDLLDPMRERRAKYASRMPLVREMLDEGSKRARVVAQETMQMVRDALELNYTLATPSRLLS